MLITVNEYSGMGFPAVSGGDIEGCIKRSDYILGALTEGRAEKAVESGGKPADLVKQAAGFQTYILLRETERIEKTSRSGAEKVAIGDYSYSTQTSESSESESTVSSENSLNVIRLLRAAGCLYAGVEVLE